MRKLAVKMEETLVEMTITIKIICIRLCQASHPPKTKGKLLSNRLITYWQIWRVHNLPQCFYKTLPLLKALKLSHPLYKCLQIKQDLGKPKGKNLRKRNSKRFHNSNSSICTRVQFLSYFHPKTLMPFSSLSRSTNSSLKRICGRSCKKLSKSLRMSTRSARARKRGSQPKPGRFSPIVSRETIKSVVRLSKSTREIGLCRKYKNLESSKHIYIEKPKNSGPSTNLKCKRRKNWKRNALVFSSKVSAKRRFPTLDRTKTAILAHDQAKKAEIETIATHNWKIAKNRWRPF